jgi:hypothetical protein
MPPLTMRGVWHIQKVYSLIWSSLWEHSRASLGCSKNMLGRDVLAWVRSSLMLNKVIWRPLIRCGGRNRVICSRVGRFVWWCYDSPCSWLDGFRVVCTPLVCCFCFPSSQWILSFVPKRKKKTWNTFTCLQLIYWFVNHESDLVHPILI